MAQPDFQGFVSNQDPRVQPNANPSSLQGTMTQPQNTVLPPPASTNTGSDTALANALTAMESKFSYNNKLMSQRNLLLKHLYNTPLTEQEKIQLDPSMLDAINSGDRNRVDMNLRLISDEVSGRNNTLDQSFKFLIDSYQKEQDKIENQRKEAVNNVLQFAQVYGSNAKSALSSLYGKEYVDQLKGMGIDLDKFTSLPTQAETKVKTGGGDVDQLYSGLSSSTSTAIRGKVSKFSSEPIVQNFATIQEGYNFASSLSDTTKNPADDQALIYSLAKALDPGSVVREGEYATAQKYAQSWIKAYGKGVEQALAGTGFLSEEARRNIKKTIEQKYNASKRSYDNLYTQYSSGINNLSGRSNGEEFLVDYATPTTPANNADTYVNQFTEAFAPKEESPSPLSNFWNWLTK